MTGTSSTLPNQNVADDATRAHCAPRRTLLGTIEAADIPPYGGLAAQNLAFLAEAAPFR